MTNSTRWLVGFALTVVAACEQPQQDCTQGENGERDGISDFEVIEVDLLSTYNNGDHPTRPIGTEPFIGAGITVSFEVPSCGDAVDDLRPGVTLEFSNPRPNNRGWQQWCSTYSADLPEAYSIGPQENERPSTAVRTTGTVRSGFRAQLTPTCEVLWVVAATGWPDPPERASDYYPEFFAPAVENTVPPVVVFRTMQFFGEDCESVFGAETNAVGQCGDGWAAEARGVVRR